MATIEPRRSGRARKAVKSYADEQAEEHELALATKPGKRKRKSPVDDEDLDNAETVKPKKKAAKKPKTTTQAENAG